MRIAKARGARVGDRKAEEGGGGATQEAQQEQECLQSLQVSLVKCSN